MSKKTKKKAKKSRVLHGWAFIGSWPRDEAEPFIDRSVAHFWISPRGAVCRREDYGRRLLAPAKAPRCEDCAHWSRNAM